MDGLNESTENASVNRAFGFLDKEMQYITMLVVEMKVEFFFGNSAIIMVMNQPWYSQGHVLVIAAIFAFSGNGENRAKGQLTLTGQIGECLMKCYNRTRCR